MNNIEVGASFSVGRVAYLHDVRKTMTPNVDPSLSQDNIVLVDELQGQSVEAYADNEMQQYIDEYNAKQKRKDRRINKTFSEYFYGLKDHCDLCYEAVCQFGNHEDLGGEYYAVGTSDVRRNEIQKEYSEVYKHMLDVFKEKYPHLKVLYAVIHFDEPNGTPHLHICYMPIGEGFKQGLSHQVSIGKALENDGIERVTSRLEAKMLGGYQISKFYREIRQKYFNKELERRGYTIKEEVHGKTHDDSSLVREAYTDIQQRETALEMKEEQFEQKQEEYIKQPVPENHIKEKKPVFSKEETVELPKSEYENTISQLKAVKRDNQKKDTVIKEKESEIKKLTAEVKELTPLRAFVEKIVSYFADDRIEPSSRNNLILYEIERSFTELFEKAKETFRKHTSPKWGSGSHGGRVKLPEVNVDKKEQTEIDITGR